MAKLAEQAERYDGKSPLRLPPSIGLITLVIIRNGVVHEAGRQGILYLLFSAPLN